MIQYIFDIFDYSGHVISYEEEVRAHKFFENLSKSSRLSFKEVKPILVYEFIPTIARIERLPVKHRWKVCKKGDF